MATPAGQGWVEVLVGLGGGGRERKRSEAAKVQGWREGLQFVLGALGESNRGVRGSELLFRENSLAPLWRVDWRGQPEAGVRLMSDEGSGHEDHRSSGALFRIQNGRN